MPVFTCGLVKEEAWVSPESTELAYEYMKLNRDSQGADLATQEAAARV